MSLFDKITQGLTQVTDLFSKQDASASDGLSAANQTEKSNWFTGLFAKAGTTTPGFADTQSIKQLSANFSTDNSSASVGITAHEQNKASLENQYAKNVQAANVNLSGDGAPKGYIQVPVTLPNNYPTPKQEAEAILTGLKFKDADIQAYNQHYQTDLVRDMSVGLGKNLNHNAGRRVYIPSQKKDVYVGYIAIDSKTHKNLKDFLAARRSGSEFPATAINNAKPSNKPSNITLDPVTVTVVAGTTAGVAGVLVETMPSQVATDIVPRAMETLGKVAPLVADIAAPAAMIAAEVAPTVMIADHAARTYIEAKDGFERGQAAQAYDVVRDAAKATAATMTAQPNLPQETPPLIFPPPPLPLPGTVDQTGKVKTVTQTTLPIAPQIATAAPGKSNQPLPPPPPMVNPMQEQDKLAQLIMATYPGATTEESVRLKLENYLLNPEHPIGGAKARWYELALGFTKNNSDELARQLVFDVSKAISTDLTPHGQKYVQPTLITGANSRQIEVGVVWITNPDGITRIVTAPPAKK